MKKSVFVALVSAAALALAGLFLAQAARINRLESTLEGITLSALCQAREEADTLALTMEKALLTTDPAQSAVLLSSISTAAEDVREHLAFLPDDQQSLLPVRRFAGQLAEHARELLSQVTKDGALSPEDTARLTQEMTLCAQLSSQLALVQQVDDLASIALDSSWLAESPAAVQALGLPAGEVTQTESLDIARAFVGDSRVADVQAAPGTSGALPAYGVTVHTDDVQLNLEITRQGGKVLWMVPETASFPVVQSMEACRTAARDFLLSRGFDGMECVYHQVYDGLCVVTLVPVQEGVVLYPDLVRVQVRMDTAQVVGLEAHGYWQNHTLRSLPAPALTPDALQRRITPHAQVTAIRLCLIPTLQGEQLCYEVSILHNDEAYLIYMDAQNGSETQLLKTIPLENGSVTA